MVWLWWDATSWKCINPFTANYYVSLLCWVARWLFSSHPRVRVMGLLWLWDIIIRWWSTGQATDGCLQENVPSSLC